MKKLLPIGIMFLVLLAPVALAQTDWEAVCVNDVLVETVTITVDSDTIPIERNTSCSFGCDSGRRMCIDYSGTPGVATPLVLFLAVEAVALILLVWAFIGVEPLQKLISGAMSAVLLFPLGLMSLNVLVGETAMVFEWLGWLNFSLAFIAVAMVIYAMFEHFRTELT